MIASNFKLDVNDPQHNYFRMTWQELYATASGASKTFSDNPPRLSPSQFLNAALGFVNHLTMHHSIEERYVFPQLAERMPIFRRNLDLIQQHKEIHEGMEKFEVYLKECKSRERELRMSEVKGLMDSWKDVLWLHLDREVVELGAENMRKYWSLEELKRFAF